MNPTAREILSRRKSRLEKELSRTLELPDRGGAPPLTDATRRHLLEEAEDLYWNELEWEHLTGEEGVDQGKFTELAFPGFLAFTRGLLLTEAPEDALAAHEPRPDVVEEILGFLAERVAELGEVPDGEEPADRERRLAEHAMTLKLVDLVLLQLYDVPLSEVEEAEEGSTR